MGLELFVEMKSIRGSCTSHRHFRKLAAMEVELHDLNVDVNKTLARKREKKKETLDLKGRSQCEIQAAPEEEGLRFFTSSWT